MPKISIIVPIYNVEDYLPRCIDSILAQTFSDFELILVDDGSPDNCGEICDEYAKKDDRIVVIHKENGGLADARNAGIAVAKGEYFGFIDSDDWIDPNMYQVLYNIATKNDADISECSFAQCSDNITINQPQKIVEKEFTKEDAIIQLYSGDVYGTIVVWNKLYRNVLFNELKFQTGKICEDQYIIPKLFYSANRIVSCDYIGYYYFYRENSIMNSGFSAKRLDAVRAFKDTRDFLIEYGLLNALEYHDATYAFILLKYLRLSIKNNLDKHQTLSIKREFDSLLFTFLKNKKLSFKEKIVMITRRIEIALKL